MCATKNYVRVKTDPLLPEPPPPAKAPDIMPAGAAGPQRLTSERFVTGCVMTPGAIEDALRRMGEGADGAI
jgi:hypothetical protein